MTEVKRDLLQLLREEASSLREKKRELLKQDLTLLDRAWQQRKQQMEVTREEKKLLFRAMEQVEAKIKCKTSLPQNEGTLVYHTYIETEITFFLQHIGVMKAIMEELTENLGSRLRSYMDSVNNLRGEIRRDITRYEADIASMENEIGRIEGNNDEETTPLLTE